MSMVEGLGWGLSQCLGVESHFPGRTSGMSIMVPPLFGSISGHVSFYNRSIFTLVRTSGRGCGA